MTFLLYEAKQENGRTTLHATGKEYHLAGLIRAAWEAKGRPLNEGWNASADDLIKINSSGASSCATERFLIDFHPSAKWRVGIIELRDVYAYSFGESDSVSWTPIMLRVHDILYEEDFVREFDEARKQKLLTRIVEPAEQKESVEFLYLQSDWRWGRNGATNAPFLNDGARDYFRNFF
jgi:hypothetical protein